MIKSTNSERYEKALVIGRFQPPHKGHVYLFEKALELAEKLIIVVGSSNVEHKDVDREKNPLTYTQREQMLRKVIQRKDWSERVDSIVPLPDIIGDDAAWLQQLQERVEEFDIVLGNNDWVNSILSDAGYEVQEVPLLRRQEYQGTFIRQQIRQGKEWQTLVPETIVSDISGKI